MGILTKEEIESEISAHSLIKKSNSTRIQGCSYDMTVGTIFKDGQIINAAHPDSNKQVIIPPGGIVTILTEEELQLPNDIAATAFAINSMSSKGFLVLNPGHVDPGFEGALSLAALNLRKTSFAIQRGEPVFTVIFQRLPKPTTLFRRNKPREDREREMNAQRVELTPNTIGEMIELDNNGPYPVRTEVQEMIRTHYLSRWSAVGAAIAALASIFAIILQLVDLRGCTNGSTLVPAQRASTPPEPKQPAVTPDEAKARPATATTEESKATQESTQRD
jgi:deoxycytidine triphosphate deaminase